MKYRRHASTNFIKGILCYGKRNSLYPINFHNPSFQTTDNSISIPALTKDKDIVIGRTN